MKIGRRILWAVMVGGLAGVVTQLGFYLCLFLPAFSGASDTIALIAFWPLVIVSPFLPDGSPTWLQWPVLNIIALTGWLFVAVFSMLAFHFLSRCASHRIAAGKRAG